MLISSLNTGLRTRSIHRKSTIIILFVMSLLAANMTVATPAAASQPIAVQAQQTGWYTNDEPMFGPSGTNIGWRGGDPASSNKGYGPARYFNNSNYGYASADGRWNPDGSWARWDMGRRLGTQEIEVFVPSNHASARVQYDVRVREGNSTSVTTSDWVNQVQLSGWHSLGNFSTSGQVNIELHYDDSRTVTGRTGAIWRSVGMDAIRMRCVSDCSSQASTGETIVARSPSAVRNLEIAAAGDDFVLSWDPPADSGSSALANYRIGVSRPSAGGDSGWSRSYTKSATLRSWPFTPAHKNTAYTFTFTAVNQEGRRGPTNTVRATLRSITTTTSSPSSPRDVRVITGDGAFEVTWTPPAKSGSSPISHYHIRYCRPSCSGDAAWSDAADVPAANKSQVSHANTRVGAGHSYYIELTAVNSDNRRSPIVELYASAIASPEVAVEPEGRSWIIDDPDALILWDSVDRARGYEIDWRYMRIDTDRLRDIYYQLQDTSISDSAKEQLSREAAALLDGTEISVSQLGGDSRPAAKGGSEVFCWDSNDPGSRLCSNMVTGRTDGFNPDNPRYRIHSDQHDKVLQVRVRAIGSVNATGSWSEWAYHPSSRFNARCTFLDTYNTIRNIQTAIDTASVILTVGGVVASIFTAGTSVVATQGVKQALILAAKEIVRLVIKNIAIRRFMISLIRDLAERVVEKSALELAGFAFGCLTHGADLQKGDAKALGEQLIQEFRDSAIESLDWERALENWKRVDIK